MCEDAASMPRFFVDRFLVRLGQRCRCGGGVGWWGTRLERAGIEWHQREDRTSCSYIRTHWRRWLPQQQQESAARGGAVAAGRAGMRARPGFWHRLWSRLVEIAARVGTRFWWGQKPNFSKKLGFLGRSAGPCAPTRRNCRAKEGRAPCAQHLQAVVMLVALAAAATWIPAAAAPGDLDGAFAGFGAGGVVGGEWAVCQRCGPAARRQDRGRW